jgi:hypothetical protein
VSGPFIRFQHSLPAIEEVGGGSATDGGRRGGGGVTSVVDGRRAGPEGRWRKEREGEGALDVTQHAH